MCPKISRRSAPGSHQKQSKRPKFFRRYAPEPCKWCKKAQIFPALRAGRLTTRFPHTYSICLYSPVLQPGALSLYIIILSSRFPLPLPLFSPSLSRGCSTHTRVQPRATRGGAGEEAGCYSESESAPSLFLSSGSSYQRPQSLRACTTSHATTRST